MLPLHETVETFLAGTIFAVASNFILIGSTKIVTVGPPPATAAFASALARVRTPLSAHLCSPDSTGVPHASPRCGQVIFTYADVFFGFPLRTIGGVGWRALEDKVR